MHTLKKHYTEELIPKLQKELKIKNPMAIPRLEKIVVNMGVRNALADKKNLEVGLTILEQITGQKPKATKAKKSIASFKLREGDHIGYMVTLRGDRMYNFMEKLITIVLPRIKDFRGIKRTSFDGKGNYALGFSEFTVFPEIDPGKLDKVQGLEVSIVTNAQDNMKGLALLEAFGMPFQKEVA